MDTDGACMLQVISPDGEQTERTLDSKEIIDGKQDI